MQEPGSRPAAGSGGASKWSGPLAIAGAALACVAVAVAAAGEPLRGSSGSAARVHLTPWLAAVPVAALIVLGVVGLAGFRHSTGLRVGARRPRWLVLATLLVVVLGALVLLRPEQDRSDQERPELAVAPPEPTVGTRHTAWPVWFAIGTGAVLAMVAATAARRRAGDRPVEIPTDATEQARQALTDSAGELAAGATPREAVIAAYARLLDGLRDAGAGRRPAEAPFEHVTRVLADLGVRPDPLRQLTALFAEARFSTHEITEGHRAAALDALREARADLSRVAACT